MYNSSTSKKQRPVTSYLARPRLSSMRNIFPSRPMSSYRQDKKKKNKKYTQPTKMEYTKRPDYADTAYREAVGRLRILLAESYTPIKRSLKELDSAGEDTDNQSLISTNSKPTKAVTRTYYPYLSVIPKKYYYPSTKPSSVVHLGNEKIDGNSTKLDYSSTQCAPPELMSFIEKQEEYIEQLEKESRFCRGELSSLLSKVKDVISENENLHEKQKSNIMKSVFNHLDTETETETDLEISQKKSASPQKSKKSKILEGPAIVFESRISELEAQLTQAKIDLRKALEDNENYRKKIVDCGTLDGLGTDTYKKQIESLQREKELMQETVFKLQNALTKIKDKENDTSDQVKRSLDVAEQAQYEKNAADLEIRRLKDELERQHTKLRDAITDQSRRISDERSAAERRYTQQIEQLTSELGIQWETTNKLQLELDKQRRENADLRRELAQKEALLDGMKKDLQNKIMSLQSDIGVNGAEKSALEQQIATLHMINERNERQSKQEITRLQAEMQSLRQRLDRADADLIHSRRENIRLTEQVASLEKEIKLNSALSEEKNKQSSGGEILPLPPPKEQQNKQLTSLIQDIESKHAATVAELEGMIHSQNQLMDKLSVECHTLTQKLEDASAKHKEEIRELQTSLNRLNSRLLNQSQIASPNIEDEDYNTTNNQRTAQPKDPTSVDKNQSNELKHSNSEYSVEEENILTRNNRVENGFPKSYQPSNFGPQQSPVKNEINQQQYEYSDPQFTQIHESDHSADAKNDDQYLGASEPNYIQPPENEQSGNTNDGLYFTDSDQYNTQYASDPNQQYNMDPEQYMQDPSQLYSENLDQNYTMEPSYGEEHPYTTDPSQVYSTVQQESVELNQHYNPEPTNVQYSENPSDPSTDLGYQYNT